MSVEVMVLPVKVEEVGLTEHGEGVVFSDGGDSFFIPLQEHDVRKLAALLYENCEIVVRTKAGGS